VWGSTGVTGSPVRTSQTRAWPCTCLRSRMSSPPVTPTQRTKRPSGLSVSAQPSSDSRRGGLPLVMTGETAWPVATSHTPPPLTAARARPAPAGGGGRGAPRLVGLRGGAGGLAGGEAPGPRLQGQFAAGRGPSVEQRLRRRAGGGLGNDGAGAVRVEGDAHRR